MPGQHPTWIIAAQFKDQITASLLNELTGLDCVRKSRGASVPVQHASLPALEVRCCEGLSARNRAASFHLQLKTAQALNARGIPVRMPIAAGFKKKFGFPREAYFVVQAIPGSMPLQEYLTRYGLRPEGLLLPEGRDLTDLFTDLAARLRAVCLLSSDFHLDDVLIRIGSDGAPCLYLGDLSKVKIKPAGAGRKRIDTGLMVDAVLWGAAPSREQLFVLRRCAHILLERLEAGGRGMRRLADIIQQICFYRQFCREDAAVKEFGFRGMRGCMARGGHEAGLAALLEDPEALFSRPDAALLKDSPTSSALLLNAPGLPWPVYVKRYNPKGRLFGLRHSLRGSRARWAWRTAHLLIARGIPTPAPLAFLEHRASGLLNCSWLVTQGLPAARGLDEAVRQQFPAWRVDQKRGFARRLARELRQAHDRGFVHGDLKAKNMLAAQGQEQLWFIDLDAARLRSRVSPYERLRDIARLNCSFLDRRLVGLTLRRVFLKQYFEGSTGGELNVAWRRVQELSRRKLLQSGRTFTG